jgi:hypothetical protein
MIRSRSRVIGARAPMAACTLALALSAASPKVFAAEDVEKAKTYFNAGATAYSAGAYAAAIQAFNESYAAAPRPAILFSLAQAERRQYAVDHDPERVKSAIAHLKKYIELTPSGGRRGDAVDLLVELEALAAANKEHEGEKRLEIVVPAKAATRVMISTSAKDATIAIDGAVRAETPVIEEVKPGKHQVKVSAPGYFDDVREVTCLDGALLAVDVTLGERPAHLSVDTVAGADITIDGRPFGVAPIAEVELSPGTHLVSVSATGRQPLLRRLTLARGESQRLDAHLPATQQRVASYLVLGGAGLAILTGGALTGAALVREHDAKSIVGTAATTNISLDQLHSFNAAIDDRNAFRSASLVAFGVSGGLLLTGGLMYLIDHPRPEAETAHPQGARSGKVGLAFVPAPGGGVGWITGSF